MCCMTPMASELSPGAGELECVDTLALLGTSSNTPLAVS